MKKIAVFASGNGSNFQAIIDGIAGGRIKSAKICLLVCDEQKAFCLERAKRAGIKTMVVQRKKFNSKRAFEARILQELKKEKIDLICLAGFMRVLSADFVRKYRNKILNIHPALLPAFKGAHAVRDALKSGVKMTGATVHFVTEELDSGPVIIRETVRISEDDTEESLLEKVHLKEHKIYPEAINLFCQGRLKIIKNKVKILD